MELLAEAESAVLALVEEVQPTHLPTISADKATRRRHVMVRARRHLNAGAPNDAIALMDEEERAGGIDVDGAWLSLRFRAMRSAGRSADAIAECEAWRVAISDDHPDRAWADAELALSHALDDDLDTAERLVSPWLDRSLSPLPTTRLRLTESLIRSVRGDHHVAAAAFEGAVSLDAKLDPRAALGNGALFLVAQELAAAAAAAKDHPAALILHERALALAGESKYRADLLEQYALVARADALAMIEEAGKSGTALDAERVNRRLVGAARAALEFVERMTTDAGGYAPMRRAAALALAAECWERAGRADEAVVAWREWLLTRPDSDPQRAEVLWRVAETQHGLGRFAEASEAWKQLLKVHPNSPHAARAPIAAARALRSIGRESDAAAMLDGVLDGRGGIDPESPAYLAALIERGRLAHATGDAHRARQCLDEALRRDPLHAHASEITLLLADAWRLEAIASAARAASPGAPSERRAAQEASHHAWQQSAQRFAEVVARLDSVDTSTMSHADQERSAFARLGLASSLEALDRGSDAALAYEETERRHPDLEVALVAIERRRALPGAVDEALRHRALRRVQSLADGTRMMSNEVWNAWFSAELPPSPRLARGEPN